MPSTAWYYQTRSEFVSEDTSRVVASMAGEATRDGWHIDPTQHQEWETSVRILQGQLKNGSDERIAILRSALEDPRLEDVHNVVLEYNVKRRGLRIDAVLLAAGALIVIEFKRSAISTIDRDQVMNYCVNLREFHELTRTECEAGRLTIVPILALTSAEPDSPELTVAGTLDRPWQSIVSRPLVCGPTTLSDAIAQAIACRTGASAIQGRDWVDSRFSPSSSILDAAISLYGQHDVSAIRDHAVPVERIRACTDEIRSEIEWAKANDQPHLVIVSGTPGSGKTLVGLDVAFDYRYRKNAVFVTGNAPLVDVLHKALKNSYTKCRRSGALEVPSGYAKSNAVRLIENADFKIIKAHKFLEKRGDQLTSADGGIVIFDEAQRTYEKGRQVLGEKLVDHEADLIMDSLEQSDDAPVIVALLGHNQAINRGERGARAWFEAAERRGWTVAISDETLELDELLSHKRWRQSPLRRPLRRGHLTQSLRFYRNAGA